VRDQSTWFLTGVVAALRYAAGDAQLPEMARRWARMRLVGAVTGQSNIPQPYCSNARAEDAANWRCVLGRLARNSNKFTANMVLQLSSKAMTIAGGVDYYLYLVSPLAPASGSSPEKSDA